MKLPVLDLHCDTALALTEKEGDHEKSLRKNQGHIDLLRGSQIGGYVQCFAHFTHPFDKWPNSLGYTPEQVFSLEREALHRELEANKDLIRLVTKASELQYNIDNGFISCIQTLEGTAGISYDPERLEALRKDGFCIVSLTWNEKNVLAGSHATGGGLTDRGREFVIEAQRLGMMIDVSHISDEAFWDIMEMTEATIIATHSNSRAVHPVTRNLTDDMFKAICQVGGVAGFNQYTVFIGDDPTIQSSCDHILHFLEMDPDCKHIALGGDLDGCGSLSKGFYGVQSYPDFADALLNRGLNEEMVKDIFWNNAFGVIEKCSL